MHLHYTHGAAQLGFHEERRGSRSTFAKVRKRTCALCSTLIPRPSALYEPQHAFCVYTRKAYKGQSYIGK